MGEKKMAAPHPYIRIPINNKKGMWKVQLLSWVQHSGKCHKQDPLMDAEISRKNVRRKRISAVSW